jgi:DNA-binding SARP family transcriptional activator/DNA-binding beta-propeller fold protein YncE
MTLSAATLEFRLLGPLEVWKEGRPLRLGGARQRSLLALLLLHANEVVPRERLIEELFGGDASKTSANALQVGISRLRGQLANGRPSNGDGGVVITRPPGYVLRVDPEQLDVSRFERLLTQGRRALAEGDALSAAATLREALALWRGPALADLAPLEFAQAEIRRLEELRLGAVMERIEADLALGRAAEVIPELEALVEANPLQERLRGQLMLALYRSGRQADALEVYRQTRELLHDELGLEPSKALQKLERSILRQEGSLDVEFRSRAIAARVDDERGTESGRRRPERDGRILEQDETLVADAARAPHSRRRRLLAIALAAGVVAAAVAGVRLMNGGRDLKLGPNTIVRIDPKTNEIVQSIRVGRLPGAIAATAQHVWVVNERDGTVSRVTRETGATQTIGRFPSVGFLTLDERGNVYASGWDAPFVWQIDPRSVTLTKRFRVRSRAIGVAVGGGSLWVVDRLVNSVSRIDLKSGRVEDSIRVGADPLVAAFGFGALWVANSDDATVSVIRPGVARPETIIVRSRPFGIAAGEGAVWVGSNTFSTVSRIDPDTRRVVKNIDVSRSGVESGLFSVAAGAGGVWAANWSELTLVRIDPETNQVVARIELPGAPRDVTTVGDDVWVSLGVPGEEFP